jgi:hypothetical protein
MLRGMRRLRARLGWITPQAGDFLLDESLNNLTDESSNILTA